MQEMVGEIFILQEFLQLQEDLHPCSPNTGAIFGESRCAERRKSESCQGPSQLLELALLDFLRELVFLAPLS